MKFILISFVVVFTSIVQLLGSDAPDLKDELGKINLGTTAGTEILKVLGDEKFSDTFKAIGTIAGKLAPFLGAIGPVISLITALMPSSDSPTLKAVKKGFANVDSQFDQTLTKFHMLNNLIIELSTRKSWAPYEMKIMVMSGFLSQYYSSENSTSASVFKRMVLRQGFDGCITDIQSLNEGATSLSIFDKNILNAIMKYADGNRTRSQNDMKKFESLMIVGVSNCVAYNQLNGLTNKFFTDAYIQNWENKIIDIGKEMKRRDEIVRHGAESPFGFIRRDIDRKLSEFYKLDDQSFVDQLYSFLSSKYEWKDWLVLAVNLKTHQESIKVKDTCKGVIKKFGKHNRNLVVVMVDKDRPYAQHAQSDFHSRSKPINAGCGQDMNAACLFDTLPTRFTSGCAIPGVIVHFTDSSSSLPMRYSPGPRFFKVFRSVQRTRLILNAQLSDEFSYMVVYGFS